MGQNKSFQESVGGLILFGQFFGLMPIVNITSKDETQLKFQWRSFRTIYSLTFLILGSIESYLASRRILVIGFTVAYAEIMLFFVISMVRAILLFRLAMNWDKIMKYWKKKENVFLHPPYIKKGWSLKKKLYTVFFLLIIVVFGEKIYYIINLYKTINNKFNFS